MTDYGFRNAHMVETLDLLAVIAENFNSFFNRRFLNVNLLETTRQTLVLRYIAGVIFVRRSTDKAERTAVNIGFEKV